MFEQKSYIEEYTFVSKSSIIQEAAGSSGDQVLVPVATPSRALAEFWGKFRKPKSHFNPMIPSSGTSMGNLGKPSSSSSVETNAIESGWRYEEKCQARMARMAEAVPGDAPAYEGPSIPDVEEATAAMAAVTIAAPTVTAHTPGVGVTHPAPAVVAEPPLPTPRPLVGTGKHAGDQAIVATPVAPEGPPPLPTPGPLVDTGKHAGATPVAPEGPPLPTPGPLVGTGNHAGDQAMVATPVAPEGPPLPTPTPLVGTGKHAGDQAMVATPVAPEGPPGLFDAEMDFIRVFENLTESVKMDDMVAVYEKRDQHELDAAVAKIKNHASLPHFEAYITTLKNCEGDPGLYEFGTEDQIQECASFELWIEAEEICKAKNQSHAPSVSTTAPTLEGKPLGNQAM